MRLHFRGVREPEPGPRWQQLCQHMWPAYERWFLREGDAARPGYVSCRAALTRHMPELVPTWEKLVELAGGGDRQARLLSLYRPTPYLSGCSQAVFPGPPPLLVRNYDYHPRHCEGTILYTAWNGTRVIAQSDSLWGVLDGLNEHGLAVSLAFGGRQAVGDGFGIPLVLRYILEFCADVEEAAAVLERVPSHMAYNVTLLGRCGRYLTAYVGPDRATRFGSTPAVTNHQDQVEWHHHATATRSVERHHYLMESLKDDTETPERFVRRFLEAPLFSADYDRGFGTLYTAVYDPVALTADYRWPHHAWRQSFDSFDESHLTLRYAADSNPSAP